VIKTATNLSAEQRNQFDEEGRALLGVRVRYTCLFTISLFLLYNVLDRVIYPELSTIFLYLRIFIALLHSLFYLLTFSSFGKKHPVTLGILTYVSIGWVITIMCLLSGGYSSPYYAGLMLVLIGFGIMMPWRLKDALFTALLINFFYMGTILIQGNINNLPIFVNNNFFLWGTAIISVISSKIWEGYRYREFIDKRKLKDAEAELVQSEKLSTIGLLAAGFAHEVNNPAYAITMSLANIDNLLDDVKSSGSVKGEVLDQFQHHLKRSGEEIDRIKKIIKTFLSYSQKNREGITNSSLAQDIESTLALLQHLIYEEQVSIHWNEEGATIPSVEADHAALNQVFTNLVQNALQAGAKNIWIRSKTSDDGSSCQIRVSNDGPPIPADVVPRIFEPFFTTKDIGKGSGLGLNIVQRIILAHHGEIVVTSEPGKGVEFLITLPTMQPTVAEKTSVGAKKLS
jgi:signal transduction histidine kinase